MVMKNIYYLRTDKKDLDVRRFYFLETWLSAQTSYLMLMFYFDDQQSIKSS